MSDSIAATGAGDHAETGWRRALARGDTVFASAPQMLRYLLGMEGPALFAEEIVARVRGMLEDLARQLAAAMVVKAVPTAGLADKLAAGLAGDDRLLGHLHALALETQLAVRLRESLGLDPVLSPLLQALIASDDAGTAETAMHLLAAQARFGQSQRRMQLPLMELPPDLVHAALLVLRAQTAQGGLAEGGGEVEASIRTRYDEGVTRLGLAARLVSGMGGGALASLILPHAGVALFASALALSTGQARDLVLLSLHEKHGARAALALRAAGLQVRDVAGAMLALGAPVPEGLDHLNTERAAALLAGNGSGIMGSGRGIEG